MSAAPPGDREGEALDGEGESGMDTGSRVEERRGGREGATGEEGAPPPKFAEASFREKVEWAEEGREVRERRLDAGVEMELERGSEAATERARAMRWRWVG